MNDNKLTIQVNVPVEELFKYITGPWNTHLWRDDIAAQECSPWPPAVGASHYRDKSPSGVWHSYKVSAFEDGKVFELASSDDIYVMRYTFADLGNGASALECHERISEGELGHPLTEDALNKLKRVLENPENAAL